MHLSTDCLNTLKTHEFWKSTDNPSLKKFLDFRFQKGVLKGKNGVLSVQNKIIEEEAQLQQNELKNQIHIERTRQILDATKDIRNQDCLLREITTKQIEKDLLNESYAKNENLEEEAPSTPPDKIRTVPSNEQENDAIASGTLQMSSFGGINDWESGKNSTDGRRCRSRGIFEDYCNKCDNIFDLCHSDIMDLGPSSEVIWEKFGTNTYPEYKISEIWEKLIQDTFKYVAKSEKSLEVPVESSKHRRNANINPMVDKVLEAKRADGLARLWKNHEEV
ncbi:7015_t:CDS:2, partial [Dentiscutata erythropus]